MSDRPRTVRRSGSAGFTLLEMVLALVIFGMIAALVYSAFFFGHRAVTSGERAADDNQRMRLVEELLGRQLRSTVYYFAKHDEDTVPYFYGTPDGMSFVTSAPQSRGGTGLAVASYHVVNGSLVLEERANFTPDDLYHPPSGARLDGATVLSGFTGFRLEFLAHDDVDLGWMEKWDARDEDDLPARVRVTIEGLAFFGGQPWIREIPLLTTSYGWGDDSYKEPPEEDVEDDDENEGDGATGDGTNDGTGNGTNDSGDTDMDDGE